MTLSLLLLAGGLTLLYFGAEGLVRGSTALALRLGVTPLLVGLTVVAFGTSSPELVVSLGAALTDKGDIALGNVVGSNICNIALILGLSALIRPLRVKAQLVRLDVPLVIAASLLLVLFLRDDRLSRGEGLLLFLGLFAYVVFSVSQSRREKNAEIPLDLAAAIAVPRGNLGRNLLLVGLSLGLLTGGAYLLVKGAVAVATALGISQAVIALTVVAVGTSLPELATSAVAAGKGEGDLAIGNIVGSNLFNILGILGLSALVAPIAGGGIGALDLAAMVGSAVLLLPLMRSGFLLSRWEGGLLLAGYGAYLYALFTSSIPA